MSNVIVTELVVDARGAEAGTAAYTRAMQTAQAAIDKMLDREERMRVAQEKATVAMTGGATSITRVAAQWQRLAAAADPVIAASQRIAEAQIRADAAVRRGVTTHEEAARVIAAYSDKLTGAAQATRDAAISQEAAAQEATRYAAQIDHLRASFDPAYASAKRMGEEVSRLAQLESAGIEIAGGYAAALDRIIFKYDESAQAAARAAEAQKRFIEQARAEQAEAAARAAASDGQDMWNRYAGVRPATSGSARASASAFEEDERELMKAWGAAAAEAARIQADAAQKAARAEAALVEQAKLLRAELDPSAAALDRLNVELDRYQALAGAGKIEAHELAAAQALAVRRYEETEKALKPVAEGTRLAGHQVQNLTFQLNDAVTMLLSGSSPFQVLATQGGQVVQALGDHPGGVRGSLSAMKDGLMDAAGSALSMAAAFGPLKIAAAAAGVALVAYTAIAWLRLEPLDELIDAQAKRIAALKDAYGVASEGADDYARRSGAALARQSEKEVLSDRQRLMSESTNILGPFVEWERASARGIKQYDDLAKAAQDFRTTVEVNDPAKAFVDLDRALEAIADSDAPKAFRDMASEQADLIAPLVAVAKGIQAETKAMDEAAVAAHRMGVAFRDAMDILRSFAPEGVSQAAQIEAALTEASASARSYGEVMAAVAERDAAMAELARPALEALRDAENRRANLMLSPDQRALAEIRQSYDAQIAELERVNGAEEAIAAKRRERDAAVSAATLEITRAENARREGYDLDLRAVEARTAAENAQIAAERTHIDLIGQGYSASEAAARAEEARALSLAGARQQLAESSRQQAEASALQIAQAQLELDLVGQSAGETARLRAEFEMLTAARQAAVAAGYDASEVTLTDAMREQAAEIGRLMQATQRLNFERDLLFERQQATRSPEEQAIADQLRSIGVEYDSAQGRADAAQIRLNNRLHESNDLLWEMRDAGKQAFGDMIEAIGSGENALDALMSTFARFGAQLASAGLKRLTDGLFGSASGGAVAAGGLDGAIGTIGQAAGAVSGRTSTFSSSGSYGFSMPASPVQAKISAGDFAQASGQVMEYAGRFNSNVDGRLLRILNEASSRFDMRVEAISGLRPGDKRFHGRGLATDVQIYDGSGRALDNYQDARDFRAYERFAQVAKQVQTELYPELEKLFRWGGYFSGPKGKYGALDSMHFDLGGAGMGGGSWAGGLTAAQRAYYPGVQSVGMGAGGEPLALARAVEIGSINATRRVASGGVPGVAVGPQMSGRAAAALDNGWDGFSGGGASAGGAGGGNLLGGIAGGVGLFASAYQGGDPLGGALSGGLGGMELGSLLGIGGPAGMLLGAGIGLIGGLLGGNSKKKEERRQRQMAADQAWSQNYPQLLQFSDEVNRVQRGAMSQRINDMAQTLKQFEDLAKATNSSGNRERVEMLRRDMESYVAFLTEGFRASFEAVTAEIAGGMGINGPFSKARDAVLGALDTAKGYIEDTKTAFAYDTSGGDRIQKEYKKQVASIEKARRDAGRIYEQGTQGMPFGGNVTGTREVSAREHAGFDKRLDTAETARDAALAEWEKSIAGAKERYDNAVRDAVLAAREGLLRLVSGDVVEQSDIVAALSEAQGAAAGLRVALQDLGMTAEETETAIAGALSKRMELLRETFVQTLQDQIDDLDGKGYLAGFRDLIKQRDALLKDAALINVDTSLVSTFFAKQAQSMVDGADLSGEAFAELIRLFPELSGAVTESADAVKAALGQILAYNDRTFAAITDTSSFEGSLAAFERRAARELTDARDAQMGAGPYAALGEALAAERVRLIQDQLVAKQREARQKEIDALETTTARLENFATSVGEARKNLLLDDNLSPLGNREQFLEAQKVFRDTYAKAMAGDETAQGNLVSASEDYLQKARDWFASSEDYTKVFTEVQGSLASAETLAEQQLSVAKKQLDALKVIQDEAEDIDASIAKMQDALVKALADLSKATLAALGAGSNYSPTVPGQVSVGSGAGSFTTNPNQSTGSSGAIPPGGINGVSRQDFETWGFIGTQYQAILGRGITDRSELDYWTAKRNAGWTAEDIIAGIKNSPEAKARGYATGGLVAGPGTGTSDSIAAWLSNGEHVTRAASVTPDTLPILDMINRTGRLPETTLHAAPRMAMNDNSALVAEIRSLREVTARQEKLIRMMISTMGSGFERVASAAERSSEAAEDQAATTRMRASGGKR